MRDLSLTRYINCENQVITIVAVLHDDSFILHKKCFFNNNSDNLKNLNKIISHYQKSGVKINHNKQTYPITDLLFGVRIKGNKNIIPNKIAKNIEELLMKDGLINAIIK